MVSVRWSKCATLLKRTHDKLGQVLLHGFKHEMSCSLNSFKGGYMGGYIGSYYRGY